MTWRDLLAFLCTLDSDALDKPVRTLVAGQRLIVLRVDADGLLDTGVAWVEETAGCE
jgi:hypothetical protein